MKHGDQEVLASYLPHPGLHRLGAGSVRWAAGV
jgi:hypothetical protein